MKTLFGVLTLLLSIHSFGADANLCDFYRVNFKPFSKPNGTVLVKNKKDYDNVKNAVDKIPYDQARIDSYLKDINDETYVISDLNKQSEVFRATCSSIEYLGVKPLLDFASNSKDNSLKTDLATFLKLRMAKYKNNPSLILLAIQANYAKQLTDIKYGKDSELSKSFSNLTNEMDAKHKKFYEALKKAGLASEKKENEYTAKEIKNFVLLERQEAAMANGFSKTFLDLVSKI
jgi:hypothetical protein